MIQILNKGFSLIELMISLMILSFVLLALGTLSAKALMLNHSAYLRAQGEQQINAAGELLLAHASLNVWQEDLTHILPQASVNLAQHQRIQTLALNWHEPYQKTLKLSSTTLIIYS